MLTALSPPRNVEGHEICESNAPMTSDAFEWDLAFIEQPHEVGS